MDRAYAPLVVKTVDAPRRIIKGIASTPTPDRSGDIFEPLGASFSNPIPLLYQHDKERPVGLATLTATADGIRFEATLPEIATPGLARDRHQEVWDLISAGLIRAVSIGFRPLADGVKRLKGGAAHFLKTEICELSLVTIPANVEATLQVIKSLDAPHLAASGRNPPDIAGSIVARLQPMAKQTTTEQITQWENKRAAHTARLSDLMAHAGDAGTTLEPDQVDEYDGLDAEVKSIDAHLVRLRALEKTQLASATPVTTEKGLANWTGRSVVTVRPNVPLGTAFVRAACAKLVCNGNLHEAAEYAKRWDDSTPEVSLYLKAAIAPGTVTDATWAAPLVNQNIANEFLELLRPATILGKIPGLRNVPFNCKVPAQTAGGTYGWVGEAKPKPVTKLAFSAETLGINKVAGIIVLTEELVRLSNPSAEALVRADMIAGIAQFLDAQFIDPAVAAVAGVNPASITNGAPTAAATANPLADIMGLINHFVVSGISVNGVTFIMSPANALSLSFRANVDGSPQFPGIGLEGGSYRGLTFITSNTAGANVIAVQPALVLYADDGGVTIDASREASLQMDSAPDSPATATTVLVSLWQTNTVGLRAERYVSWKRAATNAVKYLTAANYPAPAGFEDEGNGQARARGKS